MKSTPVATRPKASSLMDASTLSGGDASSPEMSGYLMKEGNDLLRRYNHRYFTIRRNQVNNNVWEMAYADKMGGMPKGSIILRHAVLTKNKTDPKIFGVAIREDARHAEGRMYTLKAADEEGAELWRTKIKIAIDLSAGNLQPVGKLPVSTNHEVEAGEMSRATAAAISNVPYAGDEQDGGREAARTLPAEAVETVDMFESLVDKSDESRVSTTIKIGDLVLLGGVDAESGKVDCVVNAEGFFTQRVFPKSKMDYFFIAAFRVTPALQYDALVEHTQLLVRRPSFSRGSSVSGRSSSVDKGRASSFSRRPSLEADRHNDLKGSAQTLIEEKRKNKAKLDKVLESEASETAVVHYGDFFQLQHVVSGKFLTASNDGSFEVVEHGTRNSIFKAAPRFRFREDGDGILYDDEILLNCVARGSEMLAMSNTKARAGSRADLDGLNEKHLVLKDKLGDDVTYHFNSETLNFSMKFHKMARYPGTKALGILHPLKTDRMIKLWCHEARGLLAGPFAPANPDSEQSAYMVGGQKESTMDDDALTNISRAVWQFEEVNSGTSSLVSWKKKYRLRHSLSLKYLSVGKRLEKVSKDDGTSVNEDEVFFAATLVDPYRIQDRHGDSDEIGCVSTFEFKNTELDDLPFLNLDDCTFRIRHDFEKEVVFRDGDADVSATSCYLTFDIAGLVVVDGDQKTQKHHVFFKTKENIEDTFHIIGPSPTQQKHIRIVRSMRDVAARYCKSFDYFEGQVVSGTSMKDKEKDYLQHFEDWLYKFETLLHETKAMLQVAIGEAIISGEDDSIEGTGKERMGWGSDFFIKDIKGAPNRDFQNIARESMIMDILMSMAMAPLNSANVMIRKISNWYEEELKDELSTIRDIQDHLFKLLEALINGSVDSEMYVARHYSCRRVAATTESRVRKSVHATIQDARKATQFNSDVLSWPWKNSRMLQDEHFESMNKSHPSFAQPLSLEEIDGEKPTYETEKWVESIISAASSMPTAQSCLSTLLSNNEELLDYFVNASTVQRFIDNISDQGPEEATMNFFKAICSCKGSQILSNQELCLRKLLKIPEQRAELLIETTDFSVDMYDFISEKNAGATSAATFKEFCAWYPRFGTELDDVFELADEDNDGTLTLDELKNALKMKQINLPRNDLAFVMDRCDLDNSGGLQLNEFKYFFVSQLHPNWECEFKRVYCFAKDHPPISEDPKNNVSARLSRAPWKYSTTDLANLKVEGAYPYRKKITNQKYWYDERGREKTRDFSGPKHFLAMEFFEGSSKGEFDPVVVGWTGHDDWKAGKEELFCSPRSLGICDDYGRSYIPHEIDGESLPNSKARTWIPIEKLCWVLQPGKLFVVVNLPRVADAIEKDVHRMAKPTDSGVEESKMDGWGDEGNKAVELTRIDSDVNKLIEREYSKSYTGQWWFEEDVRSLIINGHTDEVYEEFEQFRQHLQIAKYYESQINLFAEMCLDRSYNSIYEMQTQFSYDMLVNCISNDKLPDQVRSGYCLLLLRVYIDRYPHAEIRAPDPVQIFEKGEGDIATDMVIYEPEELDGEKMVESKEILPQIRIPKDGPLSKGRVGSNMSLLSLQFLMFGIGKDEEPSDKFYLVEEFVTTFLLQEGGQQDPKNRERNAFVLSVLQLVQSLVKFGFFATYYELSDVVTPLAELLNGSKDADDSVRYESTPENQLVFDSKRSIIKSLMDMTSLRDDYRQKVLMSFFKKSLASGKLSEDSLLFPRVLAEKVHNKNLQSVASGSDVPLRKLIRDERAMIKNALHKNEGWWKYLQDEINKEVKATTKKSGDQSAGNEDDMTTEAVEEDPNELVLSSYAQFRINDVFEEIDGGDGTQDYAKLDLDKMSPSENLIAICMDLMMYDDPELFECAFSLLWSQFNQRSPVVDALQHVMLLDNPVLFDIEDPLVVQWDGADHGSKSTELSHQRCVIIHVKHLKSFRQLLRRGIEAYELWGTHEFVSAAEDTSGQARPHGASASEGIVDEKFNWLLSLLGYMTAFMKLQTTQGRQGNLRQPAPLVIRYAPIQDTAQEKIPDQDKYITSVEKRVRVIELKEDLPKDWTGNTVFHLKPFEPDAKINRFHQQLLFGFGIHTVMLNALAIPIHKGEKDATARFLRQLVAAALENLRLFVKQNAKHQEEMYASIPELLELLRRNCRGMDEREPDVADFDSSGFDRRMALKTEEGIDLISMVEWRVAALLAEIFEGNPALIEKVSYSEYLAPLAVLLTKRIPETRFLRIFLHMSAHGEAAAKSLVLQTLTAREINGKENQLVRIYLHDLPQNAAESEVKFQSMLLMTLANCTCATSVWSAWALEEEEAPNLEKREQYRNANTHLRGFVSVDMCLEGIKKSKGKLALQAGYMQCLTALYLNADRLHATLRRAATSGLNPLPDIVDDLLEQAAQFKPHTSSELQKFHMTNAVIPLIYSYFTNVHHKHNFSHTQESMKPKSGPYDGGIAFNAAYTMCKHAQLQNTPMYFLPHPLKDGIHASEQCLFFQKALRRIVQPDTIDEFDESMPAGELNGFFSDYALGLKVPQANMPTENIQRLSIGDAEMSEIQVAPIKMLQNKHAVLQSFLRKMTEEEDVLFVSEAKAGLLNKHRVTFGLPPIKDTTKVPLMKFLVFEFQKLELGKQWTKKTPFQAKDAFSDSNLKGYIDPLFPSYRKIIGKMITHVKVNITREIFSGFDTKEVNQNILDILTAILEDALPQHDDIDVGDHKEKVAHVKMMKQFVKKQTQIAQLGALDLVLDVLAYTEVRDYDTISSALTLGKILLHGGNVILQKDIMAHFRKARREGHMFFAKIVSHLQSLTDIVTQTPSFVTKFDQCNTDRNSHIANLVGLSLEFCQLWMEGHNRELQEFLVSQDHQTIELKKSFNVLSRAIMLFDKFTSDAMILGKATESSLRLIAKLLDFITEISQGPCIKAQDYIIDETSLVTFVRRLITFSLKKYDRRGFLGNTSEKNLTMRTLILELLQKSGLLISSILEGRGGDSDQKIYLEVKESMKPELFKRSAIKLFKWREQVKESYERNKKSSFSCSLFSCGKKQKWASKSSWLSELSNEERDDIVALLDDTGSKLYVVFMQLASAFNDIKTELMPGKADPDEYHSAFRAISALTKRVEFIWSGPLAPPGSVGRVNLLYFRVPEASGALTAASKAKLESEVNVESSEQKKRDFLLRSADLVAEMEHLQKISESFVFRLIQRNIDELRNVAFSVGVIVNILLALSVSGKGNAGFTNSEEEGYVAPRTAFDDDASAVHIRKGFPTYLFWLLSGFVCLCYCVCFVYNMIIRAPLLRKAYLRRRKKRDEEALKGNEADELATGDGDNGTGETGANTSSDGGGTDKPLEGVGDASSEGGDNDEDSEATPADATVAMVQGAAKKAGHILSRAIDDDRMLLYFWKLLSIWFPLIKLAIGLALLIGVIYSSPSSPTYSPAQTQWIVMAAAISLVTVFFSTLDKFIFELKMFDGITWIFWNWGVQVMIEYAALYNAIMEPETLTPFLMAGFAAGGLFRFYLSSLLLIDVIFLNDRLKNVIKAVTATSTDLAVTFVLIAFIVFIFAAFGMYQFGQVTVFESDEAMAMSADIQITDDGKEFYSTFIREDDEVAFSVCPNLAVCFLEFFDAGLRTGDIVGATFDDITYADKTMTYFGRIIFGLAFFLVIGVILFDIITGIIIDKFSELREQTTKRLERLKNSTFISDIEKDTCDENGLDFYEINNIDQDKWNYLYLMAHLEFKNKDEYTGAESMIAFACKKYDISWLPEKTCWAMQIKSIAADIEDPDQLINQLRDDLMKHTDEKMESMMAAMMKKFERLEGLIKRPRAGTVYE